MLCRYEHHPAGANKRSTPSAQSPALCTLNINLRPKLNILILTARDSAIHIYFILHLFSNRCQGLLRHVHAQSYPDLYFIFKLLNLFNWMSGGRFDPGQQQNILINITFFAFSLFSSKILYQVSVASFLSNIFSEFRENPQKKMLIYACFHPLLLCDYQELVC